MLMRGDLGKGLAGTPCLGMHASQLPDSQTDVWLLDLLMNP